MNAIVRLVIVSVVLLPGVVRAATFTVVNTNSSGGGSLAQAITDANASAGADVIAFAITNLSLTIRPSAALPTIVEPVTINGRTQTGFVSTPIVEISGGSAGAAVDGLKIVTSNCVISAIVINGFLGDQIEITNGVNNAVEGCYLGLNLAGTVDASTGLNGVLITNAANNIIGGLGATNRNFISGNNQSGIAIGGALSVSNSILGNVIGLNVTNNAVVNSADGIRVNAPFTSIGGNSSAARNIISGNTGDGIESVAPLATNMIVRGNWIGLDLTGTLDRGNTINGILAAAGAAVIGGSGAGEGNFITGNNDDGIEFNGTSCTNNIVLGNTIGSTSAFAANVINAGNGILISTSSRSNVIGGILAGEANTIYYNAGDGIAVTAVNAQTNNAFRGNLIFGSGNGGVNASGIDLGIGGITINDPGDPDVGANQLQNFPVLTSVSNTATGVFITGTLNSRPSTTYAIDFYSSIAADTALNGEGQFYIGSTNLATGVDSNLAFTVSFPLTLQGRHVSATATDPFGNTSEFSAAAASVSFVSAQTFTVVNNADSGAGSLREAINQANLAATIGSDTINFAITNLSKTILPVSELATITDPVTIDGYTQPGAAVNTSTTVFNGTVLVRISGASAVSGANGLLITASNCVVRGLMITDFIGVGADGIEIRGPGGNTVEGCLIGISSVSTDQGNASVGVLCFHTPNNIIGGTTPSARNVISGNTIGVEFSGTGSTGNQVLGNLIGTSLSGATAVANSSDGVQVADAGGNIIGGAAAGAGNLISGNAHSGIELTGLATTNTIVFGNRIGTEVAGSSALANSANGVYINTSSRSNVIGGVLAGQANTIAFNGQDGVSIDANAANTNNTIRGNSIHSNGTTTGELGIDLGSANIAPNDAGDPDTGANQLQNFPVLAWATNAATETTFSGSLNSRPSTTYAIDFYANTAPDTDGVGEGQYYLGSTNLVTGADSNLTFTISLPVAPLPARYISATATDPFGNTSEFGTNIFAQSTVPGTTFTVVNTNDSGPGSLRQAILNANANVSAGDTINFAITNLSTTISPASALPTIADPVTIDGYTQPGAAVNTSATTFNGTVLVRIAGASAGSGANGLTLAIGNNTVRGLMITGFTGTGDGIEISGGGGNVIEGCLLGIDAAGTDQGNAANGVFISGSANNLIGGTTPAARNVISGNNSDGVEISGAGAMGNQVLGNLIGTGLTGTTSVVNTGDGVLVTGAGANIIGGSVAGAGNLISGNGNDGIELTGLATTNTIILGNRIGTDVSGTLSVLNGVHGININTSSRSNIIGGVIAGFANTIAFNGQDGVNIAAATANTNNTIRGNSIFSNGTTSGELGIDLGAAGVGANDAGDPDVGANQLQNFPVLAWVTNTATETTFSGSLNSRPSTTYTIDFYTSATSDTDGAGEGQYYLGSTNLTTGADSNLTFTISLPVSPLLGRYVSTTATDPFGNTSEFGTNVFAQSTAPGATFTVVNTNDSGAGSLRQAINDANAYVSSGDTIAFAITNLSLTIAPSSALPTIMDTVVIDGSTQPGFVSAPIVELSGINAGASVDGLTLTTSNTIIRSLVINRYRGDGIEITGGRANRVEGCYIGLGAEGLLRRGNGLTGINILNSPANLIGGLTSAKKNFISGNTNSGVVIAGTTSISNQIVGNVIGLNTASNAVLNAGGVSTTSPFTIIGGSLAGAGNVISGNTGDGVGILNPATFSIVQGNRIGTDAGGTIDLGNTDDGILVTAGSVTIGGSGANEGNLISGNGGDGIELNSANATNNVVKGNIIGTNPSGAALGNNNGVLITTSSRSNIIGGILAGEGNIIAFNLDGVNIAAATANTNNTIRGNSIYSNGSTANQLGIDLGADGIAANDAGDTDTGANQLQNFPVLTGATNSPSGTDVAGSLSSAANTTYILDFYNNPAPDTGGTGEGKVYLGSASVTTDGTGVTNFLVTLGATNFTGRYVSATATDPFGNTSEFGTNIFAFSTHAGLNLVVTNTNDGGPGSLREAISIANTNINAGDNITFNIPGAGVKVIAPLSVLPNITDPVTIDGYTQPGASANTLTNGNNAVILIRIDGIPAGVGAHGIRITSHYSLLRGLTIGDFNSSGLMIDGGTYNRIEGCFIGLDPDGVTRRPNWVAGVNLSAGANANSFGGETPGARCVFSANTWGMLFTSVSSNEVKGCYIGTDASGTLARGNTNNGVHITGSASRFNVIGGTNALARNVISGNGRAFAPDDAGITLNFGVSNSILGNYIGLGANGTTALGNQASGISLGAGASTNFIGGSVPGAGNVISANGEGIDFSNNSPDQVGNIVRGNLIGTDVTGMVGIGNIGHGITFSSADFNQIGGTNLGDRNVISGNGGNGLNINCCSAASNRFEGNFVGVDITGTNAMGNGGNGFFVGSPGNLIGGTAAGAGNIIANNAGNGVIHFISSAYGVAILGNSIYSNSSIGIDLGLDGGPTGNDPGDTDTGANHLQNFPVISSALQYPTNTTISASLNSRSNTSYRVEFFDNASPNASGFGEGQTYLGFTNVTTDASGNVVFGFTNAAPLPFGHYITATATDPTNNTSEFSLARKVVPFDSVDLEVVIADTDDPAARSTNHLYTLYVTNSGPAAATSVFITNTLPVGLNFVSVTASQGSASHSAGVVTCNLGAIANGGFASVLLAVSTTNTTIYTYDALVIAASQLDHTTNNNFASEQTQFGIADVVLLLTDSVDPVAAGQPFVLTATVTNLGPDSATGVSASVVVDGNCAPVGASVSQGSYLQSGNTFTFLAGTVGATSNVTLNITVIPTQVATNGHSGNVTANEYEADGINNFDDEFTVSTNGPGVLQFNITSHNVIENVGSLSVDVYRSGGEIGTVTVGYATSNLTAVAGGDYTATTGTLTFTNGQMYAPFSVAITDDLTPECIEQFTLHLFNPTGGAVLVINTNAFVTIVDDQIVPGGNVQAVSATNTNGPTGDNVAFDHRISDDGSRVVFATYASNLAAGDTNNNSDVYLMNVTNGTLTLISVNSSNSGTANGYSDVPAMSATGRYVAFYSDASNVTTNDHDTDGDIFLRDTLSNITALVSVNFYGTNSGNSSSFDPDITPDGRYIVFESNADDLVTNTPAVGVGGIFFRDMTSNRVELISVNAAGNAEANSDSFEPVVSASGRFVAFESLASNLGTSDTNSAWDVYVRDRQNSTNILCSRTATGAAGSSHSFAPLLSANERYVVFGSHASNLVPADTNSSYDLFAYDLVTHTLTLVSANTNGVPGNGYSETPSVSADGRYVAFYSEASDLVTGATDDDTGNIYVRDLVSNTTTLVSVNCAGTGGGDDYSYAPAISADGRYIAFESYARDLVSGNFGGSGNVFRRDRLTATTVLVSQNQSLTSGGDQNSYQARVSTNGNSVAFGSQASNLVGTDTNSTQDIFVWRAGAVITTVDIAVTKTSSADPVTQYDNFIYTLGVTNNGSATGTGIAVTDVLPTGLSFVSASVTQGSVTNSGNTVTASLGTLGAGAGASVSITVTALNAGNVTNSASGTLIETDSSPGNNTGSVVVTVTPLTPPTLTPVSTNGNQLLITWPSSTPNVFTVQTTTNLTPVIVWTTLTNSISDNGTVKSALFNIDLNDEARFYRLWKP